VAEVNGMSCRTFGWNALRLRDILLAVAAHP
jgi:hypothetical protein